MRASCIVQLGIVGAVLCASAGAGAQSRDPAAAEALFREGRAAVVKSDWETACPKFRESQRLDPAAGTLLNLADCEERRGKLATAWQLFRQLGEGLAPGDDRLPVARQRAAALERRLPHLTVRYAGTPPPGTKIRRGDVELGDASFGSALPVDPGTYTVTASAPGYATTTSVVTVAEGASSVVEVQLGAPSAGGEIPAKVPASTNRTAGWVIAGVGAAGLATGVIAGILTLSRKGTVDENCNADTKKCNQAGLDAAESGKTLGKITTVGLVLGAIGVGVGGYLLLSGSPESPRTAVSAWAGPGGASLALSRSW
jgi:hypothetical protein